MGPSEGVRTISQEAFDDLVRENMEDLGMDPAEALQDAIETLSLQGVDLTGLDLSQSLFFDDRSCILDFVFSFFYIRTLSCLVLALEQRR